MNVKPDPDVEVLETLPKEDTGDAIEGAAVIVSAAAVSRAKKILRS